MKTAPGVRLNTYNQRETYIWLCIRGDPRVVFGWILQVKSDSILFKDDEFRRARRIPLAELESFGAV